MFFFNLEDKKSVANFSKPFQPVVQHSVFYHQSKRICSLASLNMQCIQRIGREQKMYKVNLKY